MILERAGHDVTLVDDGAQALNVLARGEFNACIVDMQMPLVGGLDVVRTYRFGSNPDSTMPFVVLTANATTDVKNECEEVGVDAYLTKPIAPTLLLETLEQLGGSYNASKKTAEDPFSLSGSSVFDKDVLFNLVELCGEAHIREKLVPIFAHDVAAELKSLEGSLRSREYQYFRNNAHALKGTAASLGVARLAQLADIAMSADSETIARDGMTWLGRMQAEFETAKIELESLGDPQRANFPNWSQAID